MQLLLKRGYLKLKPFPAMEESREALKLRKSSIIESHKWLGEQQKHKDVESQKEELAK